MAAVRPPRPEWKFPTQTHVDCTPHQGQSFRPGQPGGWVRLRARVGGNNVFAGTLRVRATLTNWLGVGYRFPQVRILLDSDDAEYEEPRGVAALHTTEWPERDGPMTSTFWGYAATARTRPPAVEMCVLVNASTFEIDECRLELSDAQRVYFFLFANSRYGTHVGGTVDMWRANL